MNWRDLLRSRLRRNPAWLTLRRLQREGFGRAFNRRRLWLKILNSPPIVTEEVRPQTPVEFHLLCYKSDYLCAIWTLKSFYHFAGVRYPLVIHMQGMPSRKMAARLREHFPAARIISQEEADRRVEDWLVRRGLLRLPAARRASPFMMKLIDFPLLSEAIQLLALDSDILFFRRPSELLAAEEGPLQGWLFQRDPASTYNLSEERALSELGIRLAPLVNTGIMLFARDSLDLARCDEYLAHTDVARPSGWIEQTLYALLASEQGKIDYLPESYLISLETGLDLEPLVARHYAGPSRPLLTREGMPWLVGRGFLDRLREG